MKNNRILVADDEESIRWVLAKALTQKGFTVDLAANGEEAKRFFRSQDYFLAIIDIKMPDISGLDLLDHFHRERPATLIIIITAETTMKNAVEAMKRGAYDYITKPFDLDLLDTAVLKAQKAGEMNRDIHRLKEELKEHYHLDRALIGQSQPMQEVYKIVGKVSASDITVLITGESGTGKELVARAIHYNSPRLGKPFVALNCAAIPRELLESELFGHEKGAFTGAVERKTGKFEQAAGGTLFLDEIGDLALELQAKLLRVLQEREITRTGGNITLPVNVRIIAATNQDLPEKVRGRTFREDLYYRLNVVPIELPPLRERAQDIPALVAFFLQKCRERFGTAVQDCAPEALELLAMHDWPGNVRELENLIQRAALLASTPLLTPADFPFLSRDEESGDGNGDSLENLVSRKLESFLLKTDLRSIETLHDIVLRQVERPLLRIILEKTRGNQVRAAEILGINRNTLRKKLQDLEIEIKKPR